MKCQKSRGYTKMELEKYYIERQRISELHWMDSKGVSMEWFINACAIILISCVTTIMVSLTLAGVALLWTRVKKDLR